MLILTSLEIVIAPLYLLTSLMQDDDLGASRNISIIGLKHTGNIFQIGGIITISIALHFQISQSDELRSSEYVEAAWLAALAFFFVVDLFLYSALFLQKPFDEELEGMFCKKQENLVKNCCGDQFDVNN